MKNLTRKFQRVFQVRGTEFDCLLRDLVQSMDMRNSYPALFQILWHSVNPCFDIQDWTSNYRDQKSTIKRCKWKGMDVSCKSIIKSQDQYRGEGAIILLQVNCSVIFKTNPTDRGMCCTFNANAAEEIYRKSKFSQNVAALQKQNVLDSFECNDFYGII